MIAFEGIGWRGSCGHATLQLALLWMHALRIDIKPGLEATRAYVGPGAIGI